jgi:hypothetical protein
LYMITMLLFLLLYIYFLKKSLFFVQELLPYISFGVHKVKVLISIPPQEFAHLPCCYYGLYEISKYSVMASCSGVI